MNLEYTNQIVYDKVCAHLAAQKTRSMTANGCAYRGTLGRSCAVGCLIPDEIYDPDMDQSVGGSFGLKLSLNVNILVQRFPAVQKLFAGVDLGLLKRLQETHDNSDNIKTDLYSIAQAYNLKPGAELAIKEWRF